MTVSQIILYFVIFTLCSRLLADIGFPAFINFAHFPLVLVVAFVTLSRSKTKVVRHFIYSILGFALVVLVSGVLNEAGMVNVILGVLMLVEPLLLFYCITTIKWSEVSIARFRTGLLLVVLFHLILIFYQHYVSGYLGDDVVGILLNIGAGAHLSGAIGLSFAVYLYSYRKQVVTNSSFFIGYLYMIVIVALIFSVILSDAKQVFAVYLVALAAISFSNVLDVRKSIYLAVAFLAFSSILYLTSQTVFPALQVWADTDLIVAGLAQKFSVFQIIVDSYYSPLNYFIGLGPGHTVGRLAMIMPNYFHLLDSFGASTSSVTSVAWAAHQGHYLSNSTTGSSMFSLFFSWAGIWGDIGFLGIAAYLYMYYLIWREVSVDLVAKFLLLTIFIFGWVFQWVEEPQYMIFTMSLIGLRWQEIRLMESRKN